ncbi:MAG: ATP-binding protein [Eubacteriales bacterium]|nr:ATP-binding protein [Eubacteriales bacterium]
MEYNFEPAELAYVTYLLVNDGLVEDVGCAFTALTGYSKTDFCNRQISEVMRKLFGFDFDPGNRTDAQYFLFKKTYEVIEVQITVCRMESDHCKLYLFQKCANSILESGMSLVDKLMEDNFEGVGLYSCPDFRLLKANQMYLEYMQEACQRSGNMFSLCLDEMVPDYWGSDMESLWVNVSETGETACLEEQETVNGGGDIRYWNETIIPISGDGKAKYIVTILDDVTGNIKHRKRMEESYEALKKTLEMKDEMLMLISHELKTPLSIITSSIQTVELICKNELTDKVRKYLNKIKQNTYRQIKLVNNILDNTRVNNGLFKMNRASVDIVLLTKNIVESISVFAERKNIKISFSTMMPQAIIQADVDIYERILLNLLSNAVKFTPEGKSIEVTIFRIIIKGNPKLCIQVKDYGIGIPNDQKELIFERFGRVDHIVTGHSEGTGIGLYLVKMLVGLLDGDIKVESKEGVGSTFTLVLPFLKTNKAPLESIRIDQRDDELVTASAIEFSDIYYGA